jgi:hypothetical protein
MPFEWIDFDGDAFADRADVWIQIHRVICERGLLLQRFTETENGGPTWTTANGFQGEDLSGEVVVLCVRNMILAMTDRITELLETKTGVFSGAGLGTGNFVNSDFTPYTGPGSAGDGGVNNDNRDPGNRSDWAWFILRFRDILENLTHVFWVYISDDPNFGFASSGAFRTHNMASSYPFDFTPWGDGGHNTEGTDSVIPSLGAPSLFQNYRQRRSVTFQIFRLSHGYDMGATLSSSKVFLSIGYTFSINTDKISGPDPEYFVRAEKVTGITDPLNLNPPEFQNILGTWNDVSSALGDLELDMPTTLSSSVSTIGFQVRGWPTDGPTVDQQMGDFESFSSTLPSSRHSKYSTFFWRLELKYTKTDLSDDDIPPI